MLPMPLPAPVVVTDVEPFEVKEAPQPPTTPVDEQREIPTETDGIGFKFSLLNE